MRLIPRPAARATPSLALAATIALALVTCPGVAAAQATPTRPAVTKEQAPGPGTAAKPAVRRPAARRIALADVAGRWAMRVMLMGGDSTLVTHELVATADRSGWRLMFPNRQPIPAQAVAVAGDSIVTVFGPYESVLRSGVQVTTRSVYRLRSGRLYGTTIAQYATHSPDSVLQVRSIGTKIP
jgi:hypothetical protein